MVIKGLGGIRRTIISIQRNKINGMDGEESCNLTILFKNNFDTWEISVALLEH